MNKKIGVLFFSLLMVGCLNASDYSLQRLKFRFFLASPDSLEHCEVSLSSINYNDVYLICDDQYTYGYFRYLVPYLFVHVDNINLDRKRFLNVQTGECFDVEPILDFVGQCKRI